MHQVWATPAWRHPGRFSAWRGAQLSRRREPGGSNKPWLVAAGERGGAPAGQRGSNRYVKPGEGPPTSPQGLPGAAANPGQLQPSKVALQSVHTCNPRPSRAKTVPGPGQDTDTHAHTPPLQHGPDAHWQRNPPPRPQGATHTHTHTPASEARAGGGQTASQGSRRCRAPARAGLGSGEKRGGRHGGSPGQGRARQGPPSGPGAASHASSAGLPSRPRPRRDGAGGAEPPLPPPGGLAPRSSAGSLPARRPARARLLPRARRPVRAELPTRGSAAQRGRPTSPPRRPRHPRGARPGSPACNGSRGVAKRQNKRRARSIRITLGARAAAPAGVLRLPRLRLLSLPGRRIPAFSLSGGSFRFPCNCKKEARGGGNPIQTLGRGPARGEAALGCCSPWKGQNPAQKQHRRAPPAPGSRPPSRCSGV